MLTVRKSLSALSKAWYALGGWFAVQMTTAHSVLADIASDYGISEGTTVDSFAKSAGQMIITVIMIVAFLVGAAFVVMGLAGFAKHKTDPQAGRDWVNKILAGSGLLALGLVLGIILASMKKAGSGGYGFSF